MKINVSLFIFFQDITEVIDEDNQEVLMSKQLEKEINLQASRCQKRRNQAKIEFQHRRIKDQERKVQKRKETLKKLQQ